MLFRSVPPHTQVCASILAFDLADDSVSEPLEIIEHALINTGGATASRVRVPWTGLPVELTTWEDAEDLCRRFPRAPAWGQAVLQGRGNVGNLD